MKNAYRAGAFLALSLSCAACSSLWGFDSVSLQEPADASSEEDASLLDGSQPDQSLPEASLEAASEDGSLEAASEASALDAADDSSESGCSANVQVDPGNCGRCFHSCLGGDCVAGKCQPVVLAKDLLGPRGIALDSSDFFVTLKDANRVIKAKKLDGTSRITVAEAPGAFVPYAIVVDPSSGVYWTNNTLNQGEVRRCPLAGCGTSPPDVLVNDAARPSAVLVDDSFIYWTESAAHRVRKANRTDGAAPQDLFSDPSVSPFELTRSGQDLFVSDSTTGAILKGTIQGGPFVRIAQPAGSAYFMVVAKDKLVWTSGGLTDGALWQLPLGGAEDAGTATPFALDQVRPYGLAVDDQYLYWVNSGQSGAATGTLMRCPLQGCGDHGPETLASELHSPTTVQVDDLAIYWVNYGLSGGVLDGSVMKLAKP